MKRITLGSLDYGLSFAVDRTLRDLLENGRLSAVCCVVAGDLWAREFKPLQETVLQMRHKALVGVTLALSGDRVRPLSPAMRDVYGEEMPGPGTWERRAMLRLLPEELISAEVSAQLAQFAQRFGKGPDLIAVRHGLLARLGIAGIVMQEVEKAGFESTPMLVAPVEPGMQASRLERLAKTRGFKCLRKGPPLPTTDQPEELHRLLKNHFDGLPDMTFVASIPGKADDRLRREEPRDKIAIRECQREVLSSGRFFRTLDEKDVFLH
ncbi:hypothetical protein JM93_02129 [Roseibium hamelinense]|uniref:YdjC-like protein n=1 Tax=Roseibium hamelinense TaxID=150831 RepID=A0A562T2D9_9HYPH|nr:ChbG/HpnK family deacetylase [Roseibium hamelinense]MTI43363.1 ChbG/HpnK family deacetylase [Roseibium hamelinense]TWI87563.1 hypothetical protein JM93_02129 [Roseibium hamelinense]